jgi:hypothetical protein
MARLRLRMMSQDVAEGYPQAMIYALKMRELPQTGPVGPA